MLCPKIPFNACSSGVDFTGFIMSNHANYKGDSDSKWWQLIHEFIFMFL
jgi:hypothetical protein